MRRKSINIGGEIVEVPEIPKGVITGVLVVVVAAICFFSSFYTVDAVEVGVIKRLGRYLDSTDPGPHFKLPFGIDTVTKVPVEELAREEFGFRTERARGQRENPRDEALMLTGDLNSAVVEWIVQYKIKDPVRFLFNVRNVRETLRDVSESVMQLVVGDRSVDEVIVLSRQEIEDQAHQLTQQLLDDFETGIDIRNVKLQNVNPPAPVQPAFNQVNEARQERERIINEAMEAYNKVIPQARGQAAQTILAAEGYATNRTNRAEGDAERFVSIWNEYRKAESVTRRRLYIETMVEILPGLDNIYVVDEEQDGLVPLLQFPTKQGGGK